MMPVFCRTLTPERPGLGYVSPVLSLSLWRKGWLLDSPSFAAPSGSYGLFRARAPRPVITFLLSRWPPSSATTTYDDQSDSFSKEKFSTRVWALGFVLKSLPRELYNSY
jgi:hypothetical protein